MLATGAELPRRRMVSPRVMHAIYNTSLTDLTFSVVTSPPDDAEETPRRP
jgi:hypothetical protein